MVFTKYRYIMYRDDNKWSRQIVVAMQEFTILFFFKETLFSTFILYKFSPYQCHIVKCFFFDFSTTNSFYRLEMRLPILIYLRPSEYWVLSFSSKASCIHYSAGKLRLTTHYKSNEFDLHCIRYSSRVQLVIFACTVRSCVLSRYSDSECPYHVQVVFCRTFFVLFQ